MCYLASWTEIDLFDIAGLGPGKWHWVTLITRPCGFICCYLEVTLKLLPIYSCATYTQGVLEVALLVGFSFLWPSLQLKSCLGRLISGVSPKGGWGACVLHIGTGALLEVMTGDWLDWQKEEVRCIEEGRQCQFRSQDQVSDRTQSKITRVQDSELGLLCQFCMTSLLSSTYSSYTAIVRSDTSDTRWGRGRIMPAQF